MKLWVLVVVFFVAGCQSSAGSAPQAGQRPLVVTHDRPGSGAAPGTFLMMGGSPVYLSVVEADDGAPGYQALLEVGLSKPGEEDVGRLYQDDRRVTGEPVYTLVSEAFPVQELFTPGEAPRRATFLATLVRGHAGRGGMAFLAGVVVTIKRVIYARPLAEAAPAGAAAGGAGLRYLLFGTERELYAVHLRAERADFEQIASVRITSGVASAAEAAAIRHARTAWLRGPAASAGRLSPGTTAFAQLDDRGGPREVTIETLGELAR